MHIDLHQLIQALSDAIDLVGIDEIQHGKRVACMALTCGIEMSLDQADLETLYHSALLHDCGVSSTRVHKNLVNELEWEGADHHCLLGEERIRRFPPFHGMADIVRYHHTPWQDLHNVSISPKNKTFTNLVFLLDRVDALMAQTGGPNRLATADQIRMKLPSFRDNYFGGELTDLFLSASSHEAFWIDLESCHLTDRIRRLAPSVADVQVKGEDLLLAATLFADIVDAKSPYTAEHSRGVARLSRFLSSQCGISETRCDQVEVAGLLHDLGKLQVPDSILEKTGPLDQEGIAIMRHHSYVTYRILKQVKGLEEISLWAANHHERLDGSGYPFGKSEKDLTLESRIIIISDIFQALAQNRPYRESLPPEKIMSFLGRGADNGQLDCDVVDIVSSRLHECYEICLAAD